MRTIPITQYMLPNGTPKEFSAAIADDIAELFYEHNMIASCEVLTTGEACVYITKPNWEDEEELIEICSREMSPPEALEKLIKEAAFARSVNDEEAKK